MRRLSPTTVALIAGALAVLLVAFVFAGGRSGGKKNPDRLGDRQVAERSATDPESRCRDPRTFELIKRELFRRAAQSGGSDRGAFDRLYANSALRVDSPKLKSHDEEAGTISCTGSLELDPPPGFEAGGDAGTVTSDIGYSLQRAADGSGDVVRLANAEVIIIRLASLAGSGRETAEAVAPGTAADQAMSSDRGSTTEPPSPVRPAPEGRAPTVAARQAAPAVSEQPQVTGSPSFNCRRARTRGEIAVCGDAGLAGLDRQMAGQFNRSMSRGTAEQRAQLQRTRGRFLAKRDSCRSAACMAEAYRARMKEIGAITAPAAPRAPAEPTQQGVVTPNSPQPQSNPAAAGPSFNCRYARTRGEVAVCGDPGLASLDRQMAGSFGVAMSRGTPAQREVLQRTRSRFLKYRDSCRSKSCVAASYRSRLNEIGDIMAGRWKVY